jgi:hypothetical protein
LIVAESLAVRTADLRQTGPSSKVAFDPEWTSVFGSLQSDPCRFAPIQDRDARLILTKDLLVSKTPSAYLLNQQQTADGSEDCPWKKVRHTSSAATASA